MGLHARNSNRISGYGPGLQLFQNFSIRLEEIIAYTTAVLGVIGDQVSTRLGMMRAGIFESNPFAAWLMGRGLWLPFDLAFLVISIFVPAYLVRRCDFKSSWITVCLPLISGVVRLFAAVMNFRIVFS